jgi:Lar family restriction alleviation protein
MSDLLPCPFCGKEAAINKTHYSPVMVRQQKWKQSDYFGVNCISCGAKVHGLVGYLTEADAIAAWNRRAE